MAYQWHFVILLLLLVIIVQSFYNGSCQTILDPERIEQTEEIIRDNMFYPPLSESRHPKPLVFGLIMSFGGNFDSSGAVPGVRVALDRINNDTSLLPGYTLHYALSDSQCNRPRAITALFNQVPYSEPKRIALIGGGCSVASEAIAEVSYHFNITQVSCTTATPVFSDRLSFPNYFQFLPSTADFAPAFVSIIKQFNWRHVVILLQDENVYTMSVDKLKSLLIKENITYTTDLFYSTSGLASLDREPFSDPNERIYIISSYAPYTRELLCQAYHRDIRYPTHLLLTYQWYSPQWWLVEDQNYTCTGEQRGEVLHRTLSVNIFNTDSVDSENHTTSMNINEEEFQRMESLHLSKPPFNFSRLLFSRYCHDATWALAWSLNKTLKDYNLSNISYRSDEVTANILEHMDKSFIGLSGNVTFDENGIRRADQLSVFQYRKDVNGDTHVMAIGSVVSKSGQYLFQYSSDESLTTVWPDKLVPYDGIPQTVIDILPTSLVVIVFLLAAVGSSLAVGCLIFNFIFREKKILQISRPRLNYLIILGALLFYISMVLFSIPTRSPSTFLILAKIQPWTISLALSLCYGTIIMKMFRVYYIVHNPSPNKNIEDWWMLLGVLSFVIIDLILLLLNITIGEALGTSEAVIVPNKDNPHTITGELQIATNHMNYIHVSPVHRVMTGLLFSYKLVLQLIVLFLAFRTHNVKVKGLDDTKCIISAIYITTIHIALVTMSFYLLRRYLTTYTAIITLVVFLSTTMILGLIFIPKMVALYKDPKGEKIFDKYETPSFKSQQQQIQKQQQLHTCTDSSTETTDSLKKRIQELENMLATRDHHQPQENDAKAVKDDQ